MSGWLRAAIAAIIVLALAGCATPPEVRKQLQAPPGLQGFSAVYSEIDMRLQLVTAADAPTCKEAECVADRAFDQRVLAIGRRLADVAFRQHSELHLRIPRFDFIVADKRDPGTASSSAGTVVIYRGIRTLKLDDGALAFVLAREMSHVIEGHHDENVATSVLVGVIAQILFPVLKLPALISGSAATTAAATSAAATTVTTTAVASAASFAGSRALRASFRPQQVIEAEAIAMDLLATAGWEGREVADQLQAMPPPLPDASSWTEELRESMRRVASLMRGPPQLQATRSTEGMLPMSIDEVPPISIDELPPPLVSKPF